MNKKLARNKAMLHSDSAAKLPFPVIVARNLNNFVSHQQGLGPRA